MKPVYLKNFRKGLATNSSSTHSVIYRNNNDLFEDLNIFELNYYGRCDRTIAATKSAKIKYILADIYGNEELVRVLAERYPEMKNYYPLIKDQLTNGDSGQYDIFGTHYRGSLTLDGNMEFNIDYLTNIIEDENIIIVGGSDESDFVYETIDKHDNVPMPLTSSYDSKYDTKDVTKNGNYWIGYGRTYDSFYVRKHKNEEHESYTGSVDGYRYSFDGRIRFSTSKDEPVPEFPELIDLRITNKCDHGCKFCFMNSNMNEQEADFNKLCNMLSNIRNRRVEFSIGGGNILLYSHLKELFELLKECGHLINVTINVKDCKTVLENEDYKKIFMDYVDGIGISVTSTDDIKTAIDFRDSMRSIDKCHNNRLMKKYIVIHIIPEYLGVDETKSILDKIVELEWYIPVLFLGYKTNGRGVSQEYHVFTDDELTDICMNRTDISCDTTFANRYNTWLMDNYACAKTITWNEGEYSMYIDGVTGNAYKSSYQTDKPYNVYFNGDIENAEKPYSIKDAFSCIRRDGGFPVYDECAKHYWSDSYHYWNENDKDYNKNSLNIKTQNK